MAKKSARALAAAESSSSGRSARSDAPAAGKVAVADLSPKSCLTCGRVITPRAKWASDWPSIKYCSDRCRSSRPGKLTVRFAAPSASTISELAKYDGWSDTDGEVHVDIERWVEAVLLDVATPSASSPASLEAVQDRIKNLLVDAGLKSEDVRTESGQNDSGEDSKEEENGKAGERQHPLCKMLDSAPGLRERIRRAARRLALGINHESDAQQTHMITTEAGRIELLQAGKPLRTVNDLSFAKGTLHIRRKA